jgi:hypothetical protein
VVIRRHPVSGTDKPETQMIRALLTRLCDGSSTTYWPVDVKKAHVQDSFSANARSASLIAANGRLGHRMSLSLVEIRAAAGVLTH